MNIYPKLNKAIEYIENNLENEIEYKKIAQILEMNEYTAQTAFLILCDISIADYIRKRRLSNAGYDLYHTNETIMNIAIKYQYSNATSFSRAFEKFHGMKPSTVKQNPHGLKMYSKIQFDEAKKEENTIEYSIQEKEELVLYGIGIKTDCTKIKKDAPELWIKIQEKYPQIYDDLDYGMTSYIDRFNSPKYEYWVLSSKKIDKKEFKKVIIPKSKWIVIRIDSNESNEIQKVTDKFYEEFLPSTKYKLREIPELEYYDDNYVEFMIPIED